MHPLPTQSHPRQGCICHPYRDAPFSIFISGLSAKLQTPLPTEHQPLGISQHLKLNVSKSNLIVSSNLFLLPGSASQLKTPSTPNPSSCLMLDIQPQGVSMEQQQGCHLEARSRCNSRAHLRPTTGNCTSTRCAGDLRPLQSSMRRDQKTR